MEFCELLIFLATVVTVFMPLFIQCIDILFFLVYTKSQKGVDNMATANVTMRMDEELKSQLQELVSNLGMDLTTFFTITAKQAVREQRIPFNISMEIPNAETKAAIEEVGQMKKNPSMGKSYTDIDQMMEELLA